MSLGSQIAANLPFLRRYARALSRDHVAADDVVQDAVMRAIERRDQFQPDRSRRRWLRPPTSGALP